MVRKRPVVIEDDDGFYPDKVRSEVPLEVRKPFTMDDIPTRRAVSRGGGRGHEGRGGSRKGRGGRGDERKSTSGRTSASDEGDMHIKDATISGWQIPNIENEGGGRGKGRNGGRGKGGRRGGKGKPRVGMYMGNDVIPWYIKEVQDKGLDTEGEFKAWWENNTDPLSEVEKIKDMKVTELREQLSGRGLDSKGNKAELANRLSEALMKYSLSDDNFSQAKVINTSINDEDLPGCFPQVYEPLSESQLEELWREAIKRGLSEGSIED